MAGEPLPAGIPPVKEIAILVGVYLACGCAVMASIGRRRSRLEWCGKPTPLERAIVILCWWLVLLHMVGKGNA